MPDFKNGIIYKIWNPDIPEQAYYGSTAHKYHRKRYSRAKAYERTNPLKRFGNIFTEAEALEYRAKMVELHHTHHPSKRPNQ